MHNESDKAFEDWAKENIGNPNAEHITPYYYHLIISACKNAYQAGRASKLDWPLEIEIEDKARLNAKRTCWPTEISALVEKNYTHAFYMCVDWLKERMK